MFTRDRKKISWQTRFLILQRDDFACQYCGAKPPGAALNIDHIIPLAEGGTNDTTNLITACEVCNKGKSDLTFVDRGVYRVNRERIKRSRSKGHLYFWVRQTNASGEEGGEWKHVTDMTLLEARRVESDLYGEVSKALRTAEFLQWRKSVLETITQFARRYGYDLWGDDTIERVMDHMGEVKNATGEKYVAPRVYWDADDYIWAISSKLHERDRWWNEGEEIAREYLARYGGPLPEHLQGTMRIHEDTDD